MRVYDPQLSQTHVFRPNPPGASGDVDFLFFQKLTSRPLAPLKGAPGPVRGPFEAHSGPVRAHLGPPEPGTWLRRRWLCRRRSRRTNSQFLARPPSHRTQGQNTSLRDPRCDNCVLEVALAESELTRLTPCATGRHCLAHGGRRPTTWGSGGGAPRNFT